MCFFGWVLLLQHCCCLLYTSDAYIKTLESGDSFEILVSRDHVLKTYQIKMGGKNAKKYMVKPDFTDATQKKFDYWLRVDIEKH